jgi:hypothetical protein
MNKRYNELNLYRPRMFKTISFNINAFTISIREDVRMDKHGYRSEFYNVMER